VSDAMKTALLKQSNLFESLQFRYFGPIDGHDVDRLVKVMRDLKDIPGPKLLHVLTVKGKGFKFSEEGNPTLWHAPGLFDKHTGQLIKSAPTEPQPPKYDR
jgi:1-deoxy-D-xylulose-5-phosphate synthase